MKVILRGMFLVLRAYIKKKKKKEQSNNLKENLKILELKKTPHTPKKYMPGNNQIRAETN